VSPVHAVEVADGHDGPSDPFHLVQRSPDAHDTDLPR
jgi:hypothetical protein